MRDERQAKEWKEKSVHGPRRTRRAQRARTYTREDWGVKLSSSTDHQVRGAILKGSQDEERGPSSMV